jgi:hypothetical protein
MPLSKFWFSLAVERRHQRLHDFGFEAFFVGKAKPATPAMGLYPLAALRR